MKGMKQTALAFSFGEVFLYDHYIVSVINEGETVTPAFNDELVKIADTVYKDRPFGYITHRIYSYSVDPRVYLETSRIDNLKAFAVVTKEPISKSNMEIEKLFLKKPVAVFNELEEAETWVTSLIANV
ncbi:MAG: hypothetical protein AAF466_04635 [Bacteroidota bacterium]